MLYTTQTYLLKSFPTNSEWQENAWKAADIPRQIITPKKKGVNAILCDIGTTSEDLEINTTITAMNAMQPEIYNYNN